MLRRIKYGAVSLIMTLVLAVLMPAQIMTAFAAEARIAFSDPTAGVGSAVDVTMKITSTENLESADVMLAYDSSALEFVSGTDADGGNGAVRVHGDAGTPNTGTLSFSLQFRTLTAGSSKITVSSQEIYDSNSQIVTVNQQGDATVTASASAEASKDASLKSLLVSPGTITPEFSPEVDTYAVTVGTDVEQLVVSAESTDPNATVVVTGADGLQMGENRVSCRVTAQDGETSQEYVIVVTKEEGGASDTEASGAKEFKMRVSERVITVLEPDDSVQVPEGFKETTIKIDGNEVKGWVWGSETEHQYCVIYGRNEAGETNLYRYDMKESERTLQRYFSDPAIEGSVSGTVYDQLKQQYDGLMTNYNLFRILLIAAVIIALVLLVLLIAVILKKDKPGNWPSGRGREKREPEEDAASDPEEALEDDEDFEEDAYEAEDENEAEDAYETEDENEAGAEPTAESEEEDLENEADQAETEESLEDEADLGENDAAPEEEPEQTDADVKQETLENEALEEPREESGLQEQAACAEPEDEPEIVMTEPLKEADEPEPHPGTPADGRGRAESEPAPAPARPVSSQEDDDDFEIFDL